MNPTYMQRPQDSLSSQRQEFTYLLLAILLVCFCTLLFVYAVNVAWMDDIDAFLSFIVGYLDAQTFPAKIDWLLRPNNELVSLLYLTILSKYRIPEVGRRWTRGELLVSVSVGSLWYLVCLPRIAFRKQELLTEAFNQKYNETGLGASWGTSFATLSQRTMYSYLTDTKYDTFTQPIGQAAVVIQSDKNTYLFLSDLPFTMVTYYLHRPIKTSRAQIGRPILAAGNYRVACLLHRLATKIHFVSVVRY